MVVVKNYWIVGAMWGGDSDDDALADFLERGYWYCWPTTTGLDTAPRIGNSVSAQQDRFLQIKKGDRIAVKKIVSISTQEMEIRALGIVKTIDQTEWRVYVDWLPVSDANKELQRRVPLKGHTASIHGPYQNDEHWVREIFCI